MKYVDVIGIIVLVWLVAKFTYSFLLNRFGYFELVGFILSIIISTVFIFALNVWYKMKK